MNKRLLSLDSYLPNSYLLTRPKKMFIMVSFSLCFLYPPVLMMMECLCPLPPRVPSKAFPYRSSYILIIPGKGDRLNGHLTND